MKDYLKILKDLIKTLQRDKHELAHKYEETREELKDAQIDLRLLREQIVRERVGSINEGLTTTVRLDAKRVIDLFPSPPLPHHQQQHHQHQMPSSMSCMSLLTSSPASAAASALSKQQRESFMRQIESLSEEKSQLEADFRTLLCQKEELEIERDTFKSKYAIFIENKKLIHFDSHQRIQFILSNFMEKKTLRYAKLNEFLLANVATSTLDANNNNNNNTHSFCAGDASSLDGHQVATSTGRSGVVIGGSGKKVCAVPPASLNVDELVSQNRFLAESNRNLRAELDMLKATLKRFKQSANANTATGEQSDSTCSSNNNNQLGGGEFNVLNKQRVRHLQNRLDSFTSECQKQFQQQQQQQQQENKELRLMLDTFVDLSGELRVVVNSLIESLNDKCVALTHQRRVNKMLATRIHDLERQFEHMSLPEREEAEKKKEASESLISFDDIVSRSDTSDTSKTNKQSEQ